MDELTLVAVFVVIILQIVTLSVVLGNKKQGGKPVHTPRHGHGGEGRPERKDGGDPRRAQSGSGNAKKPGENRDRGGKPQQQGGRPQQQQQNQPASIDPMEKSLRDINLRLKNAERDQENARKKIQDGGPRDGRPQQRGERGERNDRPDRGDRNNRGGSGRGGNGGDRNAPPRGGQRDANREPRRDGGRPDRPERQSGEPDGQEPAGPQYQERPPRQFQQPEQSAASAPQAPDIVANDFGVSEDQLQHGRKFMKRRTLPESAGGDTTPETDAPEVLTPPVMEQSPVVENAQIDAPFEQQQDDEAIQFGRR